MKSLYLVLEKFLIITFILFIFMPGLGLFIHSNPFDKKLALHREPYLFPQINIKKINQIDLVGIENWFGDKVLLVHFFGQVWRRINYSLGVNTGRVIIGQNGWLYLGNDYNSTIDQFTGRNQPQKQETTLQMLAFVHMNDVAKKITFRF